MFDLIEGGREVVGRQNPDRDIGIQLGQPGRDDLIHPLRLLCEIRRAKEEIRAVGRGIESGRVKDGQGLDARKDDIFRDLHPQPIQTQ